MFFLDRLLFCVFLGFDELVFFLEQVVDLLFELFLATFIFVELKSVHLVQIMLELEVDGFQFIKFNDWKGLDLVDMLLKMSHMIRPQSPYWKIINVFQKCLHTLLVRLRQLLNLVFKHYLLLLPFTRKINNLQGNLYFRLLIVQKLLLFYIV